MFKRAQQDFSLLKSSGKHIFLFELTYKLVATSVAYPLMILLINLALKIAGISYLTNEYILKAVTHPLVIIMILFTIVLFVLYCAYEMSFLTACFEFKRRKESASIIETGYTALQRMKRLFQLRNLPLNLFYFISILAVNVTILCNVLYSQTAVNLLRTYILYNRWQIKAGLILLLVVIYLFVIRGIYTFPIFIIEKVTFKEAYKKSRQTVRKHFVGTMAGLIGYNIGILVLIGLFYVTISVILIAGVKILDMAYLGSAIYLSILKNIRMVTKLFLIYIAIPFSYSMISRLYYKYGDTETTDYDVITIHEKYVRLNRCIYFFLLAGSIVLNISYVALGFNKNPFDKVAIFHETKITAHRGDSHSAPENTLSAFKKAMDNMADYIELDVRQTKDGKIVVMHDNSTFRTTGVARKVGEMTLDEIKQLDAGSFFDESYAGEEIPTLDEVLELVNGKIMVNIEIKTADTDQNIAQEVVKVIDSYDAQDKVVITSFDYHALQQVKQWNPDIQVGYILSVAYGDFYNMDGVDFFSMNASFLSIRLVDAIHNSGKQVYAWTVNNEASIKNLSNKGVDNIITDNPVLARETIYSRDTSETLINMIKYVFNG